MFTKHEQAGILNARKAPLSLDFDGLCEKFGYAEDIPHDDLYALLTSIRQDLSNLAQLGTGAVKDSPLGVEVRRRCKQDLIWLAGYFTWETNPEGAGKDISENRITEESHGVMCKKFFVQKDDTKTLADQSPIKNRLVLWPRGGFKALDVDTLVPTPHGFTRMGDVIVGTSVFSEKGDVCRVVGVSPIYHDRPCYEVEFATGEKIAADEDHLWETYARSNTSYTRDERRGKMDPAVFTTKEIAETLVLHGDKNHRVRVARALDLPDRPLPLHPYVLGCWLGDGTSASACLTCADPQIIEEIRSTGCPIEKRECCDPYRYAFNGGPGHPHYRKHGVGVTSALRALGVLNNKHIPSEYLRASYDQRMSLIQGLMDTDGHVAVGGKCVFNNSNEVLARDFHELAASLGFKPTFSCHRAQMNGQDAGPTYFVIFKAYADTPVCRLDRKRERQVERPEKRSLQNNRTIVAVRPVPSRPVRCIMVDSPSHLYLVGRSFIPTHNTTLDIADTVQWLINFPEIRILFLTAAIDLAVSILDETKGHFVVKIGDPSLMNLFFPEFCVEEKDMGNEYEFTCPVWAAKQVRRREPSILAGGIDTTLSGKHFEVIKGDDTVSNRNSESEDQCRKVTKNFGINKKMLRPFGYIDLIGTRYSDVDMYGDMIERNVGEIEIERGVGFEISTNPDMSQIILIGKAITIKPEVAERLERESRPVTYKEAGEDGCDLLLPTVLSYKFLCGEFAKDEIAFEGQMNQNPRPASAVTFDRATLVKNTIPWTDMPQKFSTTQVWDFAFSTKKGRDYTTACSVKWSPENTMNVHDLIRARFKPAELAKAVVDFAVKWKPMLVAIEDVGGARFLEQTILAEARKTKDDYIIGLMMRIDWFPADNQKDAKKMRMASLHPWLVEGRMKFLAGLPHLEVLYSEFEKCMVSHHHDDIPDVISQQPRLAPRIEATGFTNHLHDGVPFDRKTFMLQAGWNLMFEENCDAFGVPGAGVPTMPLVQQVFQEVDIECEPNPGGGDNILGSGLFG